MTPVAQQAGEPTGTEYNRAREMADAVLLELDAIGHGWNEDDIERIQTKLLPDVYDCLNVFAVIASRPQQPQAETPLTEAAQRVLHECQIANADPGTQFRRDVEAVARAALSNTGAHPPEAEPKPICRTCGAAGCSATCGFSDYASPPEARADNSEAKT